jgi:AbrB family looped-hinge helix DNA binding protein
LVKIRKKCIFLVFALSVDEAEFTAYIRRNGRITVPKEVRDALDIEEGDLVKCKIRKVEAA